MINNSITVSNTDYRKNFMDIAEKLFDRNLINSDKKIKLLILLAEIRVF